jgi:hypothetical protein
MVFDSDELKLHCLNLVDIWFSSKVTMPEVGWHLVYLYISCNAQTWHKRFVMIYRHYTCFERTCQAFDLAILLWYWPNLVGIWLSYITRLLTKFGWHPVKLYYTCNACNVIWSSNITHLYWPYLVDTCIWLSYNTVVMSELGWHLTLLYYTCNEWTWLTSG